VLLLGFLFLLPERCAVNMAFLPQDALAPAELRERVELAPGFSIAVYASDLPGVRVLRFTEAGDLLASLPEAGSIVLLERDRNGDGWPDGRRELVGGLERPHGIDIFEGFVYVGETGAIGRMRFDAKTGQAAGPYRRVVQDLPAGGNHWSRSVRFGPDGLMYVTVGSSCNVCIEDHPWRAAMLRLRADGSGAEVYATGLRNTVAFDWQSGTGGPGVGVLYGADIGRDLLGDDVPPDEAQPHRARGFLWLAPRLRRLGPGPRFRRAKRRSHRRQSGPGPCLRGPWLPDRNDLPARPGTAGRLSGRGARGTARLVESHGETGL